MVMLACKLYVGNVREKTKIKKMLKIQEEALTMEHGREWKGNESYTNKPEAWIEEVNEIMSKKHIDRKRK